MHLPFEGSSRALGEVVIASNSVNAPHSDPPRLDLPPHRVGAAHSQELKLCQQVASEVTGLRIAVGMYRISIRFCVEADLYSR